MTTGTASPSELTAPKTSQAWATGQKWAASYVNVLLRRHPSASPGQILHVINQQYRLAMATAGTGAGLSALGKKRLPALLGLSAAHLGVGGAITMMYIFALAHVYGLDSSSTRALLQQVAPADGPLEQQLDRAWWRNALAFLPVSQVRFVDGVAKRSLAKAARKGGVSPAAKVLPGGIGAGLGIAGGRMFARQVINSAHDLLGDPPREHLVNFTE